MATRAFVAQSPEAIAIISPGRPFRATALVSYRLLVPCIQIFMR